MLIILLILQALSKTEGLALSKTEGSPQFKSEGGQCPEAIEHVVQTCIEESGMYNIKHTIGSVFIDGRLDTQFCRGGMKIAVTCLENILNVCQDNLEQKMMLNLLVDFDKLRTSFYYFCKNIHVFATNQSCIDGLYHIPACIERVTHQNSLQPNSTYPDDLSMMLLMDSLCGLSDVITTCYTSFFADDCNMTSQLFLRLFDGARFPYCDLPEKKKRFQLLTIMKYSSSSCFYISSPRFIVLCLVFLFCIIKVVI